MELKALELLKLQLNHTWELYEIGHKHLDDINLLKEAVIELEELEIRSCENCTFIRKYNKYKWECSKGIKTSYHTSYIEHDFCCNKWELK